MGLLQNQLVAWVLAAVLIAAAVGLGRSALDSSEVDYNGVNLTELVQVVD